MCGLCGILTFDPSARLDERLLRALCQTLVHRGPDDEGVFLKTDLPSVRVGLGVRRLSIIDLPGGHQPILSEDGSVCVAFNGEIYNFRELRRDLEARGHTFSTKADTEVLVHLYEDLGDELVHKLNGMFGFAIWDGHRQRLLLGRDRLGVKPLFYWWNGSTLLFGSEIKPILLSGQVERQVDLTALHHYLSLNYSPREHTLFKGIRKLLPGHLLTCADGQIAVKKYWDALPQPTYAKPKDAIAAEIVERLREAVRKRLVSDVPLGVFLSGGIDSSTVTALASQVAGERVKTFSIGFEEASFSELEYSRLVARRFNTDHHEMVVRCDIEDLLPKLVWHSDEPSADSSAVPTYFLSKFTREHVKVALSGDGGDEMFGGYETYVAYKVARLYRALPSPLRWAARRIAEALPVSEKKVSFDYKAKRFAAGADFDPLRAHFWWNGTFSEDQKRSLYSPDVAAALVSDDTLRLFESCVAEARQHDMLTQLLHADRLTYLPDDILVKVDRMSMANSLEVRTPFLDYEFVEFVQQIPADWKVHGGQKKHILKRAVAGLLPPETIRRKKQGFSIPVHQWLRTRLRPIVCDALSPRRTEDMGLFRPAAIQQLLSDHFEGRRNNGFEIWGLLILSLWHDQFIRNFPPLVSGQRDA